MPNRILRDGIVTSPRIAKLGWAEEVFYRRLMSVVDDFGRYYADSGMLRAACYPRQLSKVSDSDIDKWLCNCTDAGLVRVYPAKDGERYLELLDFRQQVRAKESKFPALDDSLLSTCVADATQTQSNAHLDVDVCVDVGECPAEPSEKPSGRAKALSLTGWLKTIGDADAVPADHAVFRYADKVGIPRENLNMAWEWMLDTYGDGGLRKAKRYIDWPAVFRNAVEGNWPKLWWFDADGSCRLTTTGEQRRRLAA